jgi:Ca2+-binding RTX toxin-like protein
VKNSNAFRFRPRFVPLEDRHLPAAALTATLTDGLLRIEGTDAADAITVRRTNDQVSVANLLISVAGTKVTVPSVPASELRGVEVLGLGGKDFIRIDTESFGGQPLGANAVVDAGAGDDTVFGGSGDDRLDGGPGNDTLRGNGGADALLGGDGDDTLTGNAGNDALDGGAGTDQVTESDNVNFKLTNAGLTGLGADTLLSVEKAFLAGGSGANVLDAAAFSGTVRLSGGSGDDTLVGGAGADELDGGGGNDTLFGNDGDDELEGDDGTDQLFGGNGNDVLNGAAAGDPEAATDVNHLDGGPGFDTITAVGTSADDTFTLTNTKLVAGGTSNFVSIERGALDGRGGKDKLNAAAFSGGVNLKGGDGDDVLTGGTAVDQIDGEAGNDSIAGGAGGDVLVGGDGNDFLSGGDGGDTLNGSAGDDQLDGGAGNDTMTGGAGADLVDGGVGFNFYSNVGVEDARRVVYVQFDGANVTHQDLVNWAGTDWSHNLADLDEDNDGAAVAKFLPNAGDFRETAIGQVMDNIYDDYRAFGVDVVRRNAGEKAVVGQNATTLFIGPAKFEGFFGLRGIASDVDFGNNNKTDVAFAGIETDLPGDNLFQDIQYVSNTAAHEIGHTFGLRHVDNQGLNESMRVGFLASNDQNAQFNYTFLDRSFDAREASGFQLDANGNRIQQNSYRTLGQNLGVANLPAGPLGTPVPAVGTAAADGGLTIGDGCGCPLCSGMFDATADPAEVEMAALLNPYVGAEPSVARPSRDERKHRPTDAGVPTTPEQTIPLPDAIDNVFVQNTRSIPSPNSLVQDASDDRTAFDRRTAL